MHIINLFIRKRLSLLFIAMCLRARDKGVAIGARGNPLSRNRKNVENGGISERSIFSNKIFQKRFKFAIEI